MKTKICTKCGEDKLISDFNKNKRKKDGLSSWCTECNRKHADIYYRKYPWKSALHLIKQRCTNKNNPKFPRYGGRGIKCLITVEELEKLWFRDEAWLLDKPSIDREDNDGNYIYDNCRFIEMIENSTKDKGIPVLQYDLGGIFIREWSSATEAGRRVKTNSSNITQCCKKNINYSHAGGYIWKYKN